MKNKIQKEITKLRKALVENARLLREFARRTEDFSALEEKLKREIERATSPSPESKGTSDEAQK